MERRRPEGRQRRARPADESIEELDPASAPDPDFPVPAADQRQRIVTGGIVVGGLLLVAALYYGLRSSPCDELAVDVCATLGGECQADALATRFGAEGLNGTTCSTAFDAVREVAGDPKQYREKLVGTLGFDPLAEQQGEAPAQEAPPEAPKAIPIVQGQKTMSALFVDRSHIYWTVTQPPAVYRIRSIGGEPELMSQTPMPGQLGVSENFAYWVSAGAPPKIWADKVRGEHDPVEVELVEGYAPSVVAFMGPEAAFIDGQTGAVHIVAVANDTPTQLAPPTESKPVAIAGNTTLVAWSTPGPSASVMVAPRKGGAPRAVAQGQSAATLLEMDDAQAYWADPKDGSIAAATLNGGEVTTLVSGQPGISDIAVGADALFWSNAATGQVLSVPKVGGEPRVVATGLDAPRFIALDGAAVYWESGGVVYRLPQ